MVDKNLEIVEISLTVVTPWSLQDLIQVWMLSLVVLAHGRLKGLKYVVIEADRLYDHSKGRKDD